MDKQLVKLWITDQDIVEVAYILDTIGDKQYKILNNG